MGLVKSLYILAPQQQPHHLIFAKMKHIFQAHLFLLPIINSVRFDIVEQQCACNKGILMLLITKINLCCSVSFPWDCKRQNLLFSLSFGLWYYSSFKTKQKTSNNTTKSYCLGKYRLMTLFAFFHREIKSGIGAVASKIIK